MEEEITCAMLVTLLFQQLITKAKEQSKKKRLTLNIKKPKLMTIQLALELIMKVLKWLHSFCELRSIFNSKGTSNQETCHRLALSRIATESLDKKFRCLEIPLSTEITVVPPMTSFVIFSGRKNMILKKQDRKLVLTLLKFGIREDS